MSHEITVDVMDVLGEWDPGLRPEYNGSVSLDVRPIDAEIIDVRALAPPAVAVGGGVDAGPATMAPVILMEVDVRIRLRPLPSLSVAG